MDTVTSDESEAAGAKPRVLYVTNTSILDDGGGGEERARNVLAGLSSRGFDATVVCGRTRPGLERWDDYEGYRIRHVRSAPESLLGYGRVGFLLPRYLFAFASLPVIASLLARGEFDVIVENMAPYPTLTVLLAKLFSVPIVAVQHEFHGREWIEMYDPLTSRILLIVQNVLRLVEYDALVVPAAHTKRQLREYGVATDRIEVVPNGIEYEAYSRSDVEREPGRLVTIGRLCKRKGQDELVRAFARLHEERPETHLDIVGKGPRREQLKARVSRLGIAEAVTFHGYVTEKRKIDLLARADLFVFASKKEGFGLVLLEAMAAGLPIVARSLPVYRDFVESGVHGYLVDEPVIENMRQKTTELLSSGNEIEGMRETTRSTAAEYDWGRTVEQMESLLLGVVRSDEYTSSATLVTDQ